MKITLERKCHADSDDSTCHDHRGYINRHHLRPDRGGSRSDSSTSATNRPHPRNSHWSTRRGTRQLCVPAERGAKWGERAVKPAERKQLAWKAIKSLGIMPFCGLFSLHKKIAQNGRLSPEAASGTAGRT